MVVNHRNYYNVLYLPVQSSDGWLSLVRHRESRHIAGVAISFFLPLGSKRFFLQ
ncbi:MAG: hypothetical protein WAO75_00600 [Atribacterales bacterium]